MKRISRYWQKTPNLVRWKNSYQIYLNLLQPLRNYARNPAVCTQRRDRTSNISRNPSIHFTDREEQKKKKTRETQWEKEKKRKRKNEGVKGGRRRRGKKRGQRGETSEKGQGIFHRIRMIPGRILDASDF